MTTDVLILLAVLAAVAAAILRRNKAQKAQPRKFSAQPLQSADESGPSQTGRYRVQQMFARTAVKPEEKKPEPRGEQEEQLPDPFTLKDLPDDEEPIKK